MIEEKSATELFTLLPCPLSLACCSGAGSGNEGDRESGIPVGYHQAFAATIAVSWGGPWEAKNPVAEEKAYESPSAGLRWNLSNV